MKWVVTAAQMRALDAATIDDIGLPGAVLMETAGRAIAEAAEAELARDDARAGGRVAVVCGTGNNGGDGFVAARCLNAHQIAAAVYLAGPRDRVTGDAAIHLGAYEKSGGEVRSVADAGELALHHADINAADVVIDAVFGTGLSRDVTGHMRHVLEAINASAGRVVAADIPSGLDADTGQVLGVAVSAHATVTMAFLKRALAVSPGYVRCGRVLVAEIGIPETLARQSGIDVALLELQDAQAMMPPSSPIAHKGTRGHVLAVAGSPGKRGAGRLVSMACLRAGAGLATLASPWRGAEILAPDPVMTTELDPDAADDAGRSRMAEILAMTRARVIAIGPGMPVTDAGRELSWAALEQPGVTVVADADALNHFATDPARIARAPGPVILTPHPGEAARLLATDVATIERDRVTAARKLFAQTGKVVVLKGARTLVADGSGITINPTGTSGLATAGTGDVLAGVIAGLCAQGLGAGDAARLGVFVHGRAGELAADRLGERGMTAQDVLDAVPAALRL